jgi:hypothetical protein
MREGAAVMVVIGSFHLRASVSPFEHHGLA